MTAPSAPPATAAPAATAGQEPPPNEPLDLFGLKVSFLTWEGLRYLILPAVTLSLYKAALVIRLESM